MHPLQETRKEPDDVMTKILTFQANLKNASLGMDRTIVGINEAADTVLNHPDEGIDVRGYTDGPKSSKVPPSDIVSRYFGTHQWNAVGAETAAIFYTLKHVTNVHGYRIIDLNYPTLARMIADLDKWNAKINLLQLTVMSIVDNTHEVYENILKTYEQMDLLCLNTPPLQHIHKAACQVLNTTNQYWSEIDDLYRECKQYKDQYISTRMKTYSPNTSYYHWSRAKRPMTTLAPL